MPKSLATRESLLQRKIVVDVPGTETQLECRRPDPLDQATLNLLPLEQFAAVVEAASASSAGALEFAKAALGDPQLYGDFVDRWVCAAVVVPRVVMTREEAETSAAVWVEDLEPDLRMEVWSRTNDRLTSRRVSDAVKAFRAGQSDGPRH